MSGSAVKRKLLHRAVRVGLWIAALPLTLCAALFSLMAYGTIARSYSGESPDKFEAWLAFVLLPVLVLVIAAVLAQCVYVAFTGVLPLWLSEPQAREYEKLNRNPWVFLIFSVLFSSCALLFIGYIYFVVTR